MKIKTTPHKKLKPRTGPRLVIRMSKEVPLPEAVYDELKQEHEERNERRRPAVNLKDFKL